MGKNVGRRDEYWHQWQWFSLKCTGPKLWSKRQPSCGGQKVNWVKLKIVFGVSGEKGAICEPAQAKLIKYSGEWRTRKQKGASNGSNQLIYSTSSCLSFHAHSCHVVFHFVCLLPALIFNLICLRSFFFSGSVFWCQTLRLSWLPQYWSNSIEFGVTLVCLSVRLNAKTKLKLKLVLLSPKQTKLWRRWPFGRVAMWRLAIP